MKEIDKEQFEGLCELQCTQAEFCCFFNVTDKTLDRWCKDTYKNEKDEGMSFSEIFAIKRGKGKISLRRAQFQLAQKNAAMAIFLGQQYLGQRNYATLENEKRNESDEINKNLLAIADLIRSPKPNRELPDE